MKKHIILALILAAPMAHAQSFQEGFFLDGYTLGYRSNPALSNEGGTLGLLQLDGRTRNNVGAASFLYPSADGEVLTALHESVPAAQFLGNLRKDNYINKDIGINLVSYGWRKGDAYHTVEANLRALAEASVPLEIFQIIKQGTGQVQYDLGGMKAGGEVYAELAYGLSYRLSDAVSVGARAKLLVGIESVRYQVNRLDLSFSEDRYTATMEASLDFTSRIGKVRTDENGYLKFTDISAKDKWRLPSGGGLALDLGVAVTPCEGLSLSASVLNLGGIVWYYGNAGRSSGSVSFDGVENLTIAEIKDGRLTESFQGVLGELKNSIRIAPVEKRVTPEFLPFTVNLGIRYKMPFYEAVSVGATGSYIGWKGMPYKEVSGALAWNPCDRFGITGNIGTGDYGMVFGAALSVGFHKFHLNAGLQNGFGGTIPYRSTPLQANNKCVTFGLTYDL